MQSLLLQWIHLCPKRIQCGVARPSSHTQQQFQEQHQTELHHTSVETQYEDCTSCNRSLTAHSDVILDTSVDVPQDCGNTLDRFGDVFGLLEREESDPGGREETQDIGSSSIVYPPGLQGAQEEHAKHASSALVWPSWTDDSEEAEAIQRQMLSTIPVLEDEIRGEAEELDETASEF